MSASFREIIASLVVGVGSAALGATPEVEVVKNRLFTVSQRLELGATYGLTVGNTMIQHQNFNLDVAYNFSEPWAVVVGGGYALGDWTSVAQDVFTEVSKKDPTPPPAGPGAMRFANDFANMWALGPHAEFGLRWAPIYGKVDLSAEVPVHFQAYLTAGAGAGAFSKTSVVFCLALAGASCTSPLVEHDVKPVADFGGGLRVLLSKNLALKVEVRDYMFPDQYFVAINRAAVNGAAVPNNSTPGAVAAYCSATGNCAQAAKPGFSHIVLFDPGVQVIF